MSRWGWSEYLGTDATAPPGAATLTPQPPSVAGPRDEKEYMTPPCVALSGPPAFAAGARMP